MKLYQLQQLNLKLQSVFNYKFNTAKVTLSKNVIDLNKAIKHATLKYKNVYFIIDLIPPFYNQPICYTNQYVHL